MGYRKSVEVINIVGVYAESTALARSLRRNSLVAVVMVAVVVAVMVMPLGESGRGAKYEEGEQDKLLHAPNPTKT